jgi:hypothetical protein
MDRLETGIKMHRIPGEINDLIHAHQCSWSVVQMMIVICNGANSGRKGFDPGPANYPLFFHRNKTYGGSTAGGQLKRQRISLTHFTLFNGQRRGVVIPVCAFSIAINAGGIAHP